MLNTRHIRRRFERAADSFDDADFVHAATRDGLLSRLQPLLVDARTVLDLGAATGSASRPLQKRFKGAHVVSVDLAKRMLMIARGKKSWLSKSSCVQADARQLPFAGESVDVVFANLLLPWIGEPARLFVEVARVLRKGGVFAFATLGPDSLQELARAWRAVDDGVHVNRFPDMHDIGDALVNAGLRDPVLDIDRLAVEYGDSQRLFDDLTASGGRNALADRRASLTGRRRFEAMRSLLRGEPGGSALCLDLELVFGHCWGAGPKFDPTNVRIDPGAIPLRRR